MIADYNLEAEADLLGIILNDNSIIKELSLTPEHFHPIHQTLFAAMQRINREGKPITPVSLLEDLGEGQLNALGGLDFIQKLFDGVASVNAYEHDEKVIIEKWKNRKTKQLFVGFDGNIQNLISELNQVDQVGLKESFNLRNYLTDLMELPYTEVPKGLSGIPSGLTDLDDMTDGFQKQDSIIIGARPSMGKTAFMLNIAQNAGQKDILPVIFSLEMSAKRLLMRMISSLGNIDGSKLKNPYQYLNDIEKARWSKTVGIIDTINPYIFDASYQTVSDMRSRLRNVQKQNPDKEIIVLIDYLTLIQPQHQYNGNSHQQVSEISRDLKSMAKEFDVPVITLAQLSRGVESRSNKRPLLSDLRESGSIEQDSDLIIFLYREDYYEPETDDKNILEVNIAKHRDGPVGTVFMYYDRSTSSISDLERRRVVGV